MHAAGPRAAPRDLVPAGDQALRAEAGDTLVMTAEETARFPRIGQILAVLGPDGSPPYRVRWLAGEYESQVTPGPGARVEKGH
jgi:hypothetical protein